ncbi:MAG: helix-turn-helix domain-containing protein [Acidobacteriaceae bacterium]|jgi:excisionase family DNA binding protein|nr:helix-turn-helix domain-containing protein [Acidobacteriaceae bacterium]
MTLGISEQDLRETRAAIKKRRPQPFPHELLRISDAAALAGLHSQTVRKWVREGRIQAWGWRGSRRVKLSDLLPESTLETSSDGKG